MGTTVMEGTLAGDLAALFLPLEPPFHPTPLFPLMAPTCSLWTLILLRAHVFSQIMLLPRDQNPFPIELSLGCTCWALGCPVP